MLSGCLSPEKSAGSRAEIQASGKSHQFPGFLLLLFRKQLVPTSRQGLHAARHHVSLQGTLHRAPKRSNHRGMLPVSVAQVVSLVKWQLTRMFATTIHGDSTVPSQLLRVKYLFSPCKTIQQLSEGNKSSISCHLRTCLIDAGTLIKCLLKLFPMCLLKWETGG